MGIRGRIDEYLNHNRESKAALILNLLLSQKYVTCAEIINFRCENTPLVFTTCPQKIIERLRKALGYDVIKDEDVGYKRTVYRHGKPFEMTDYYKRYFLDLEGAV